MRFVGVLKGWLSGEHGVIEVRCANQASLPSILLTTIGPVYDDISCNDIGLVTMSIRATDFFV